MRPDVKASVETYSGRAIDAVRNATLCATLAALLLWWVPSLLLALARLWGDRLRFWLAIGLGRALVEFGLPGAARHVYAAEAVRAERRMREIRRRSP